MRHFSLVYTVCKVTNFNDLGVSHIQKVTQKHNEDNYELRSKEYVVSMACQKNNLNKIAI